MLLTCVMLSGSRIRWFQRVWMCVHLMKDHRDRICKAPWNSSIFVSCTVYISPRARARFLLLEPERDSRTSGDWAYRWRGWLNVKRYVAAYVIHRIQKNRSVQPSSTPMYLINNFWADLRLTYVVWTLKRVVCMLSINLLLIRDSSRW